MTREAPRIDISTRPDYERLIEEVARTRTPRVITRGDEEIAVLSPTKPRRRLKGKRVTQADIDAALATFGAWRDVDTEQLKRDLDAARSDSTPPVEL